MNQTVMLYCNYLGSIALIQQVNKIFSRALLKQSDVHSSARQIIGHYGRSMIQLCNLDDYNYYGRKIE